jgi:hypothetical protein
MRCYKVTTVHKGRSYTFASLDGAHWVWFGQPEHGSVSDFEFASCKFGYVQSEAFDDWTIIHGCAFSKVIETTIRD